MANYSIDIGFDKGLLRHPATSLAALLSQGVTKVGVVGNPVYVARNFILRDRLEITAYDLSAKPTEISAISVELFFSRALPLHDASPVPDGHTFSKFNIYPSSGPGGSTVFQDCKPGPRWFFERDDKGCAFPASQLQTTIRNVGDECFDLVNFGHFYYTILLSVTWAGDSVQKSFRVDPEMIVTNDPVPPDSKRD